MAHRRLPTFALEYMEGGGETEATLARNLKAFDEWRFTPRMLVDVSRRSLGTTLFGRPMPMPVGIAPTGLNGLFWSRVDKQLAAAAAEAGVPLTQSTMSNDAVDEVARVPNLRHWWQLYVFGQPSVSEALVARAREAGCETLVVTTDDQVYGNREWDRRLFSEPGQLTWSAKFDATLHPRWLATTLLREGMPSFKNIVEFVPEGKRDLFGSAFWVRRHMDQALAWESLARIRALWPRRLIVKGVLRVEDVERAIEAGADAVWLSNHGGRQLDTAVSALDVLPEARRALGGGVTIIADGGVRRGTDVVKTLALGANLVMVGRATLYGLAAGGKAGVARALQILREEVDRTLGLVGATSIDDLGPHFLTR